MVGSTYKAMMKRTASMRARGMIFWGLRISPESVDIDS
jgi:hypothetical protein